MNTEHETAMKALTDAVKAMEGISTDATMVKEELRELLRQNETSQQNMQAQHRQITKLIGIIEGKDDETAKMVDVNVEPLKAAAE